MIDEVRNRMARDGVTLAYRAVRPEGARRALVLLHGAASNHTRWWDFIGRTRLARDWILIAPDLRGHAGSVYRGRVDMRRWGEDLEAILDAEGIARAVVGGHCLGANLALWFARQAPRRTAGLVLIEPMFRTALRGRLALAARLRPLLVPLAAAARALARAGLYRRRLEPLDLERLDRAARATAAAGGRFPVERYGDLFQDLRTTPAATYVQDLLEVTGPLPDLRLIAVPALALVSSGRAVSDPGLTEHLLSALLLCEIVRIDAHHWIPAEKPDAMREAIDRWCESLAR
jgi:pimeloyl-ACP methyl ester carboxylesterase